MVVRIELSGELERKLADRARAMGQNANQYVQQILERDLTMASLDEVLAPFRNQVENSGISDEELDGLVEQAREAHFQSRQRKST
jgi:hypothetical protein